MSEPCVAVAPGRHAVRVALGRRGEPARLVAELPPGTDPLAAAAHVAGPEPAEVLVVSGGGECAGPHPGAAGAVPGADEEAGPPRVAAAAVRGADEREPGAGPSPDAALPQAGERVPGARPRVVPAALAVAAGRRCVVVDAGWSGTVVTRVRAGQVVAWRSVPIGGDRLDRAVAAVLGGEVTAADARGVRERLSLLPETVWRGRTITAGAVAAVLAPLFDELMAAAADLLAGSDPVVLIGGVARTPLLAERLDAAGIVDPALVEVAPRPEMAALLAVTALPLAPSGPSGPGPVPRCRAAPRSPAPQVPPTPTAPSRRIPPSPAAHPCATGSPPGAGSGRRHRLARSVAAAGLVGVLAGSVTAAVVPPSPAAVPAAAVPGAGVLVQYGYRLTVPTGWEHTGGLPERRRSLLTRVGTPEGADLIAVERTPLGYDSGAEPDRARTELRAVYDAARAAGSELSGFGPARLGDRDVVAYREREGAADVDWFVVLDGTSQLSVGCRPTPAAVEAVRAACAVVVGSLAIT